MKIFSLCISILLIVQNGFSVSLWHTKGMSEGTLFTDVKARNIGDIVTIIISESSSASKKASTTTNKKSSVDGSVTSLLYANSGLGQHKKTLPALKWSTENKFEGGGEIKNTESLTVKIAATVVDVFPNGNLLLQGRKKIEVDQEKKIVLVSGIARSRDVNSNNIIDSEDIANFNIRYEGHGPIGDNQRRGLLTRLLDMFGFF